MKERKEICVEVEQTLNVKVPLMEAYDQLDEDDQKEFLRQVLVATYSESPEVDAVVDLFNGMMESDRTEVITRLYEELDSEACQNEVAEWIVEDQSWMQSENLRRAFRERWGSGLTDN